MEIRDEEVAELVGGEASGIWYLTPYLSG